MTGTHHLALVVVAFLAFALVVLAALSVLPATAKAARGLWPVMISEIVIVAVALLLVVPGGVVTGLGIAALAARCGFEAATVTVAGDDARPRALAFGAALAVAACLSGLAGVGGTVAGVVLALGAGVATGRLGRPEGLRDGLVLALFPALPLVLFAAAATGPDGGARLLLAFLLVETMDSAAVLGGRLFGRHPAFPRLSPRKTVEGLAAGALGVAIAALVLGVGVLGWPATRIVVVAIAVAAATVAGDLVASWVKRRAGVKDYPAIHPVQGGVLDVVDAWIVATPVLALVSRLA